MKLRTDRLQKLMSGRKSERVALWCVRVFGVLALALLVLFFSGTFPQLYIGRGDLFRLSSIKQYEEEVNAPYHVDESVHTAPLDSAIVWWLGDSFSRVQFGHKPLPEEVSDVLSAENFGKVSAVDYVDLQGSPKSLFALAAARAAAGLSVPKVIVIECVERNVAANFGAETTFNYGDVAPWNQGRGLASKVKKIRRSWFMEAPGMIDFKLRRFPLTAAVRKVTDTWRHDLLGDEHINASVFHGSLLFGEDENFGGFGRNATEFDILPEQQSQKVVETLASLDALAQTFGSKILFVMPPNRSFFFYYADRYTYGIDDLNRDSVKYNLYDALDSAHVHNVNLYKPFVKAMTEDSTLNLYWKTDSHWNGFAHKIATKAISEKLKEMLK